MALMCRAIRGSMACLAAFLTLFSGTPHVECLCPDGHIKLFCLSSPSGSSSCCCRGSCCQAGAGEKKPAGCCCCHGRHARGRTAPGSRVSAPGCRKTLSHAEKATLPAPMAKWLRIMGAPALLAQVAALGVAPADANSCRLSWQSYHQPPPTDLVIALGRLTI
jgi:hypothetical protein